MRAVKGQDTKPEMIVRRLAHRLGYRFRLHQRSLPGNPDLVFSSRRKVIFVHGCFWHGHDCRRGDRRPATNTEYWNRKLDGNIERDIANYEMLKDLSWDILIIWECETKNMDELEKSLKYFLESDL
jgi:DNA mismatch endonuclease (patch repair protein)